MMMETILSFAGEVVVKGTVILLLASGVTLVARGMSAAFRHLVWCGAMVMLLMLPMVVMGVPGWRIVPVWKTQNAKIETQSVMPEIRRSTFETPIAQAVAEKVVEVARPVVAVTAAAPVATVRVDWVFWSVWAWAAGLMAMLLPVVGGAIYLRVMERRAGAVRDGEWGRLLEQVRKVVGIRRRVVMFESGRTRTPMTFGFVWPRIVVPAETAGWGKEKRRMVLLHELTHVKRLDAATQTMAAVVRAMWWFHPLVWVAYRQMGIERERACDDRVLLAGADAAGYAETLVEIAAGLRSGTFLIGGIAMARQSTLETRVRAVLDEGCKRGRVRAVGILAAGLLVLGVVPLGALRGADEVKKDVVVSTAPTDEGDKAHPRVKLSGGTVVEIAGICRDMLNGPWWGADGSPVMPTPEVTRGLEIGTIELASEPHILFRLVDLPADTGRIVFIADAANLNDGQMEEARAAHFSDTSGFDYSYSLAHFAASREATRSSIKIGVAQGAWKTLFTGTPGESGKNENGQFVIGNVIGGVPGGSGRNKWDVTCGIRVTHGMNLENKDWCLVAVDTDGKEHVGKSRVSGAAGNLQSDSAEFTELPVEKVKSIRLQTRPIEWAEFKDLPLAPGKAGEVTQKTDETDAIRLRLMAKREAEAANKEAAKSPALPVDGKFYYVMGDAEHAGVYALGVEKLTPLQAVASAGLKNADKPFETIRILRQREGKQEEILRQKVSDLLLAQDTAILIEPGDVVWVGTDIRMKQQEMAALATKLKEDQNLLSQLRSDDSAEGKTKLGKLYSEMNQLNERYNELEKTPPLR